MLVRILFWVTLGSSAYSDLLIRDVTIVDVASGTALPNRSILVRGDRIARIGTRIPEAHDLAILNARGKFVIPGLWDMHVHLSRREYLSRYLAQGVTGVRDMGSDFDAVRNWRDDIRAGKMTGPHIETCGAPVDGFPSEAGKIPALVVRSPMEARTLYDRLDDDTVDFIAVRTRLPRDAYFALIERARKYFTVVAGDIPAEVSALEAVDNRQRSFEHMSGIVLGCSTEEHTLRGQYVQALERRDWAEVRDLEAKAAASFSAGKAAVLFDRMATFETRSVPVLRTSPLTGSEYQMTAGLMPQMLRSGVAIMAGSDDGQDQKPPGDRLQQELELLVASGLTTAEALRAATLEPAKYLDAAQALGTVEEGKIADLVLLDGDPLRDIRNVRKISAVILAGKLLDSKRLQKLHALH